MSADAGGAAAARPARIPRRLPPPLAAGDALFLDIDGTLVDLAPTPDRVLVDVSLARLLPGLAARLGGALALVTGRAIRDVDRLFAPLVLPVAGQHGCERRDAEGTLHFLAPGDAAFDRLRDLFIAFASRHEGLAVEHKGASLALHYRGAPSLASHVHQTLRSVLARENATGYALQPGKRLVELKPGSRDKGKAIADFMREAPFAGRRPVFVGDDLGDEHGFRDVARMRGLAIKVGPGRTRAAWRLPDVRSVRAWLAAAMTDDTRTGNPA